MSHLMGQDGGQLRLGPGEFQRAVGERQGARARRKGAIVDHGHPPRDAIAMRRPCQPLYERLGVA